MSENVETRPSVLTHADNTNIPQKSLLPAHEPAGVKEESQVNVSSFATTII